VVGLCIGIANRAQATATEYDSIVQKGNSQLQAGSLDVALASAESAIEIDATRWEAYALAGGALMNLKRYEEAADKLSEAIKRAPESKQSTLRDLRRQCLQGETGSVSTSKETQNPSTTQAEVVLWKTIENSTNPNDFQSYLNQYPNGAFAALAQSRLIAVKDQQQKAIENQQKLEQDAVWTDPATGLVWTRHDNGRDVSWSEAAAYCSHLSLLRASNWQVPTNDQLKTVHASGGWTGRSQIRSEFQLSPGGGFLWTSSHSGAGGYFSGKLAQDGYLLFPEKAKGDGIRTLCVRTQ